MAQAARDMRHGGRFHLDDRGIRYCDIFPEIERGDINVSYIEPGAAALWHRHQIQADYQIVVKGGLKIGVCNLPNTNYNQTITSTAFRAQHNEAGDTASVTVNLKTTDGGVAPDNWVAVTANSKVRIEMIAPKGGTLIIERTLPKVLTANMNLE